MRSKILGILAVFLLPATTLAQELADRIPADAEIYIGWKGGNDLGAAYAGSHLKAINDVSQSSLILTQSIPALVDRLSQSDPDAGRQARLVLDSVLPILKHPTAIYFGGVDLANPSAPMPKLAVLCDAGDDAADVSQKVNQLLQLGGTASPLRLQTFGTLLVVSTFNYSDHPTEPLAQSKQFQDMMAQQVNDPVVAMYVDATAVMGTASALVQQFAPPQAQQMWPQIRDALGLDGIKYIAGTDGFDGKNWASRIFVAAPAPRKGLLGTAGQPLTQEILTMIPKSASMAGAGSCDLNALFTQVDSALQQINPDIANQFHQGLQQINQMLGFDIQKDFLAALGTQWAYYVDPATAGTGALGITMVNRPADAQRLESSLTSLENFANMMVRQQLNNTSSPIKFTVEIRQFDSNGTKVHYLAVPFISPSWAIKDGKWYGALYPQMVVSAINRQSDGQSILDNPGFQAVMKELNAPSQFDSFQYLDLQQTIPQGYQAWLMMSRLYLGYGDLFGMQIPPMVLPPLDKITAEAEPAGTVSWGDDNGFYVRSLTPFPGAEAIGAGW